jgi:glutamate--cysteine ligase
MHYKINSKEELENFICHSWNLVNSWIDQEQNKLPQPFTSSVDIRESKVKFASVDHNMYPAGFNNLCQKDLTHVPEFIKSYFENNNLKIKTIGILPESHTKNKFYLDHLYFLKKTFETAGFDVILFTPDESLFENSETLQLSSFSNFELTFHKSIFQNGKFQFQNNEINLDFILLNNDQSFPLNIKWEELKTPIAPSPLAGWYRRKKSHHFEKYKKVADEFCHHFQINPDLIQAKFTSVDHVDFSTREGIESLANEVDQLMANLPPESSVFVKASQGTYGMGISVVKSGEDIRQMNRKTRNKMDIGKNNLKFTSVLVQEGVETVVKYDDAPAEVTIYLINGKQIGGFLRTNPLKDVTSNLNSQGMIFRKFCISEVRENNDHQIKEQVYTVIARLATLAASQELKELMEKL